MYDIMDKYLDTTLTAGERAKDLLSRLSLEEKMAQVNCLFPFGNNWEQVWQEAKYGIGQVSTLCVREITSLEEAVQWQRDMQDKIMEKSPHHIPAVFHMEALCGPFIQDSVSLPSGIGRASSWNPELEEKLGRIVARQELAWGATQILAPVLDITRDSRMGRQCESYGEDPTLASASGAAYTKGIQEQEVAGRRADACAKHFLGSHNTQGGIHGANCDIPERLLIEVYGKPFQAAITESGLQTVMPCYCSINGEPASASHHLLTELLRDAMGFTGTCIADYGAVGNVHKVQHVTESVTEAGLRCMEAGMDLEMQSCTGFNDELRTWFSTGKADVKIWDQAVQRILEAKFRMGIFENPYALTGNDLRESFFDEKDDRILLQMAEESLILLKNNGVLPIKKNVKKIAVVGCHAKNARIFFGGYTHESMMEAVLAAANSIAGIQSGNMDGKAVQLIPGTQIQSDETEAFDEILRVQKPDCQNLLAALKDALPDTEITYAYGYPVAGNDLSHMDEALDAVRAADLVIMTLGGKNGSCSVASMGEGVDGTNINLPVCQDTFIQRAAKLGKPLIGIHFDGRPISSDIADEYLDAIIEAWNPAQKGAEAITRALTGVFNPGGKLPVSVARSSGQVPIYYNHPNGSAYHQGESIGFANYVDMPHTPRYYFGYGLSYTTFKYSDFKIDQKCLRPEDVVRLELTVENTGERAGDEVVQLYVVDKFASATRPVKELAGFKRVTLESGEKSTLTFEFKASQMAFLDRSMRWKVEKGEFEVQVGSSSEDIRLKDTYLVTEDAWVDGKHRGFYAKVTVKRHSWNL